MEEDTIFKIVFTIILLVFCVIVVGIFLVIIKILFLFMPEINILGITMTPQPY